MPILSWIITSVKDTAKVFDGLQGKVSKAYFFSSGKDGVVSTDISTLDVGDEDPMVAEWGGLSAFSGKASEVVSKYYQE